VNVLLLSLGGGGGNVLRSLKTLFRRDLAVAQRTDAKYADRLRRSVTARFLDTNEFSLADVPKEERLLIGAATTRCLGSMHNPDLARQALEESRQEVESLLSRHSVVIVIGTGGKGTGAGTIFPIARMARQQKKIVIPIFVRPSFERHEVEKVRYDHALRIAEQFDEAGIRLMEILNDRGYTDAAPEPQAVVWERMNLPIARGLRGLLYVLWDLSQVDPSDLSVLFAGPGRLRVGFSELDPPVGQEPSDEAIQSAVRGCWDNPYCTFEQPEGTSLVCIQGDWSNVVDGKIKAQLAALALRHGSESPYNPLHARALYAPRPWGVTTLFAEYTGSHAPIEIDWSAERRVQIILSAPSDAVTGSEALDEVAVVRAEPTTTAPPPPAPPAPAVPSPAFATFWEFALAVNRSDPEALKMAAGDDGGVPMDGRMLKKLLGTFWFRSVFARLSAAWQARMLDALAEHVTIPDHPIANGRRVTHLREMTPEQHQHLLSDPGLPEPIRPDVQLLVTVAALWGADGLARLGFPAVAPAQDTSRLALLLQPFRHG